MYRLMRNTHLILGLAFVLALGVYMVSSVRLAHRSWFSARPTVSERTLSVDPERARTPRALGAYLIEEHGLRGEIARVQPAEDGAFSLVIRCLGTGYQIRYTEGAAEAQVRENRQAFTGMLLGMHFAHGFWHDQALINVWGAVLLLTSCGLFLIGITGIYLWFKTYDERRVGTILLVAGLSFAFISMYLIRSQG